LRVLQLFNNWKWTGPAEYACNLASALGDRGIETTLACGAPPKEAKESFFTMAKKRGLSPCADFALNKHFRLRENIADYRKLRAFIDENRFNIIHTHLTNGHLLGSLAAKSGSPSSAVIRTCYESDGGGKRDRFLYKRFTDGIIAVAHATRRAILEKHGIPEEKVKCIPAAIDTDRFDPRQGLVNNRSLWGIDADAPVVGIVARVQQHRRFDVFLEGVARAVQEVPLLKVMVIGRGTHIKSLAIDPAREMGLEKHFVFTGYRKDDYVETLNCMDVKIFLVPGSDQSCRAVREAMALGKPVIAARRGMLPEMVDHGVNGLVIEDTPRDLAQAIIKLAKDKELRQQLGNNAFEKAHTQYSLKEQVKSITEFYQECIREKQE
jgi:glycosyltransferase involved in cell wall biosynthesis